MPLLSFDEERTLVQLASGLGSRDVSKPHRAVAKYLEAANLFELTEASPSGIRLMPRGAQFRGSENLSRAAIRAVFYGSGVPRAVFRTLSTSNILSSHEAKKRLAVIGREDELDPWLDWLEYACIIVREGDEIRFAVVTYTPMTLYSLTELRIIEEERYRALAAADYGTATSGSSQSYRAIVESLRNFKSSPPEKAERELKCFVAMALGALGVITQTEDGPREASGEDVGVGFGPEGEDAVGFFLRAPLVSFEYSGGLVVPMELKRTASDKKAVGQAVTAAGRWRSHFEGKIDVIPLTLSDSQAYAERSAREYAIANAVVHLSVEILSQLATLQKELFLSRKSLLTPVHIWTLLREFADGSYIEPTTEDIMQKVNDLLQRPNDIRVSRRGSATLGERHLTE